MASEARPASSTIRQRAAAMSLGVGRAPGDFHVDFFGFAAGSKLLERLGQLALHRQETEEVGPASRSSCKPCRTEKREEP